MSTNLETKKERADIFKNFIKKCIYEYDKQQLEQFEKNVFNDIINTHKKLLIRIINRISSIDSSVDKLELIQGFILEYFKKFNKWNSSHFNQVYKNFLEFLEKDINKIFYFTPLYNFKASFEEFLITDDIKIRKIQEQEKMWLGKKYEHYTPVKTNIIDLTHILIINIEKNSKTPSRFAKQKIDKIIDFLRIFKQGDVRVGGLYYFGKSEKWNPENKITRINYEPIGIYSTRKYYIKSNEKNIFLKFFLTASKCYPKIENLDYFDRSIKRFSNAIERDNTVEKILDFVISLESLLVSGGGDSTLKLSQRAAILDSKNDNEIVENFEFMRMCYNFRSGIVHESKERDFRIKNIGVMNEKQVILRLENSTRQIIRNIINFSHISKNNELSHSKLIEKIDEMLLNRKLWQKYKKQI